MSKKRNKQEETKDMLDEKFEIQEPLIKDHDSELTFRFQGKRLYIFKAIYRKHGSGVFVKKLTCELNQSDFDMDKCIQYIGKEKIDNLVQKAFVTSQVVSSRLEVVLSPQAY